MALAQRSAEYERPWLYPKQLDALFNDARYACVESSTKAGKTVAAMAWLLERALIHGKPGQHFWWIAPVYPQSFIAFDRMRNGLPPTLREARETDSTITLPNATVIDFKSGEKPDNLYGQDVYAAVVDEASRVREEAWHAIRSTLTATRGPVRLIGNVHGRKNWFYRMARRAEAGDPDMHYAKITAADAVAAGVLQADEIEDARRQLPAAVFRELYMAEASDDGGNPFGLDAIAACVAPLSTGDPIGWGWDLARSVDWTVGIALDKDNAACRFERFQAPWPETMNRIIRTVGDATPALVDQTGVGDPVLAQLQQGRSNFAGFLFSQQSKQQLMQSLALAIQGGGVKYPAGVIQSELEDFEYRYSRTGVHYAAADGLHDDAVCALALALRQCEQPTLSCWVA